MQGGILDPRRVFDGFASTAGGMDGGRNPILIEKNQAARMDNMICRGGDATVRPGIRGHDLSWENRDMTYDEDGVFDSTTIIPEQSVVNFHEAQFQGASYFAPRGTSECIMASVGGRLYQIIPKRSSRGCDITEIKLERRNRSNIRQAFMAQADRFHLTQDGESRPIIFDGITARRATDKEVPVGTIMAYGMGRIIVVINGRELEFGDLYGSHPGPDPGDSVLQFTETTFLNEGGRSSIAFALGAVTGLVFVPQQDSSVGDGELLALSENGISSFFLSQPRELWKESSFQRVALSNVGGRGHLFFAIVNGDLWFRSDDGLRTYRQARAEIGGWQRLPMSTEVGLWMEADTKELLKYGSAIQFHNRLIATCTPRWNKGKVYHNGLISLDFHVLSSFGQASRPSWDGHWSKLKFLQLVSGKFHGVSRAFAFALDADGNNQIYELSESDAQDYDGPITWKMDSRSMDFDTPFSEKEMIGGDIWVDDVHKNDPVTIHAYYRPDQHPDWQDWKTLPAINGRGTCQAVTCGGCPTVRTGFFARRTLPKPADACDAQSLRQMRRGFEFQTRLTGAGHCRIKRLRLHAYILPEDDKNVC